MAQKLTVGVIGYSIATTLIKALRDLPTCYPDLDVQICFKTLCGRNLEAATKIGRAFSFEKITSRWQELVDDPEINLLVNAAPNDFHALPCIQALQAGKHVFCEKPLAHSLEMACQMAKVAARSSRLAMVGYNYRFVPAVTLTRQLIQRGRLGRIFHGGFRYFDEALVAPDTPFTWRMDRVRSGRGVLGDLGSHAVDLARFLLGEPTGVSGFTRVFVPHRGIEEVTAPGAAFGALHFSDGSLISLEASSFCTGRKNSLSFEIHGQEGAISWNLERLNELQVYLSRDRREGLVGFQRVYVSRLDHPNLVPWPPGEHPVGIDLCYLLELHHLVVCLLQGRCIKTEGADFENGLRVERLCAAMEESSRRGGSYVSADDLEI